MRKYIGRLLCRIFGHPYGAVVQCPGIMDNGLGHYHKIKRPFCCRCGTDLGNKPTGSFCWKHGDPKKEAM